MPDFVSENSLNASELEAQLAKAKEANEKHILEEEPERKSLYEQLKESKEQKHLEYQKLLETQNSSYMLDEKSAKFYDEIKRAEKEKEGSRIKAESEKLKSYRDLKKARQQSVPKPLSTTSTLSTNVMASKPPIIIRKRKPESHSGTIVEPKKIKDSNASQKERRSSPTLAESGDDSSKTPATKPHEIRHRSSHTTPNTLQGLGDYVSSDED